MGCLKWGAIVGLAIVAIVYIVESSRKPAAPLPDRYLDSRSGAALERTVTNIITQQGFRCDKIRSLERMDSAYIAKAGGEDGRWVDCNQDGVYGVLEVPGGFKVVKR